MTIAPRQLGFALQQLRDRGQALVLLQQPVLAHRLIEQQRRRIGDVLGADVLQHFQRFIDQVVLGQPAADEQPQVVADQRRQRLVGQAGELRQRQRRCCPARQAATTSAALGSTTASEAVSRSSSSPPSSG